MLLSHRGHSDVEGGRLSPGAGGTPSDGKEKPPRGYGSSEAAARWRRIMLLVIASTYLSTAGGGGGGGGGRGDRCLYCFLVALSFISYPPVVLAFLLAVTLHNFPEGLAVGVGFGTARRRQERDAAAAAAATATTAEATSSGGGGSGDEGNYFNGARSLAFGIALQNFPGARLSYASSAPLLLFYLTLRFYVCVLRSNPSLNLHLSLHRRGRQRVLRCPCRCGARACPWGEPSCWGRPRASSSLSGGCSAPTPSHSWSEYLETCG